MSLDRWLNYTPVLVGLLVANDIVKLPVTCLKVHRIDIWL